MKKFQKILIVLLSVALVCTGLIMAVSASDSSAVATVGDTEYATFDAAVAAALANEDAELKTVKLTSDATVGTSHTVASDLTVDLGGHTLTLTATPAFEVTADVALTITGDGNIVTPGKLVVVEDATLSPSINIIGSVSGINITHDGSVSSILVSARSGYVYVNNVNITAVCKNSGVAIFTGEDATSTVSFEFIGVQMDVTGNETSSTPASAAISLPGTGNLIIKSSRIFTDGTAIKLGNMADSDAQDRVLIDNSYIKAVSTSYEISAIGMYATIYGTITARDSFIEGSYRLICTNNENKDVTAETDENGIISVTSGAKLEAYNTIFKLNKNKASQVSRALPVFLYDGSKVLFGSSISGSIVQFDTATAGKTNAYTNIYLAEGSRINLEFYTTKETQGFKFPDGTNPGTSETYTFVYDPVGDVEAPYVVAKIGVEGEDTVYTVNGENVTASDPLSDADFYWFADGWDTWGIAGWEGGATTITNTLAGSLIPTSNLRWNQSGIYEVVNDEKDTYFSYTSTVSEEKAPVLNFSNNACLGAFADYGVIVMELDIATNSALGYTPMSFKPAARDTNANTGDGSGSSSIKIAQDGSLTFNSSTSTEYGKTAKLSTDGSWNRISIVLDTATLTGYYYINGNLAATASSPYKSGTYFYGMRFDVTKNITPGLNFLADNASIEMYSAAYDSAVNYLGDHAMSPALEDYAITIGGIAYDDLDSAMEYANDNYTIPQVNKNLENQVVSVNGRVSSNGNVITLADGSYGADVAFDADGNTYYYEFDEAYSAEITAKWYIGELGNASELANPDNYVTEVLGYGSILNYTEKDLTVIDKVNYTYSNVSGWDTDGDGKGAMEFSAVNKEFLNYLGGAKEITLYPTYDEVTSMTIVILDNETGDIVYYTNSTTLTSTEWQNFVAGTTFKLLSDFTVNGASGFVATGEGNVYNLDFNGHVIYITTKATYIQVQNGATLNVYSSVPGGMFYGIEHVEASRDKSDKVGAGVFVQLKDSGTESLDQGKASTYATTLNLGKVTVGGETYDGSNLTIAGDCLVEPRVGGYNASVNVTDTTLVRVGTDYGAGIFTRYYYGELNLSNVTYIAPAGGALIGNHTNGKGAECVATVDNCIFIFDENNGTTSGGVLDGNNGFKSITFTNSVTNGRMNPSSVAGVNVVGLGNAAFNMAFRDSDVAEGVVKANYNVPMEMPAVSISDYSDLITQDENGTLRIKRWVYSSDTSIGTYGGAVDSGYLYIYPYGYEGETPADAYATVTLPLLKTKTVAVEDAVTVTYNGLGENGVAATEYYVKGGNVVEATSAVADPYVSGALKLVHSGWDVTLPINNISENITVDPTYTVAAGISGIMANLSIYSDFGVNVYVPAEYKAALASITESGSAVDYEEVEVGGISYLKVSVKRAAKEATKDVVLTLNISQEYEGVTYTPAATVSINVASYAAKVLAADTCTDADKALMNYMIAYANEAAKFQNEAEDATLAGMVTETTDYDITGVVDTAGYSAALASATVDTAADLAYVFTVAENFAGTVEFKYAGITKTFAVTGGEELRLGGMKVYNFAGDVVITATAADGTVVLDGVVYNLATFVNYHAGADCEALAKAFYNYAKNAYEYKNAAAE